MGQRGDGAIGEIVGQVEHEGTGGVGPGGNVEEEPGPGPQVHLPFRIGRGQNTPCHRIARYPFKGAGRIWYPLEVSTPPCGMTPEKGLLHQGVLLALPYVRDIVLIGGQRHRLAELLHRAWLSALHKRFAQGAVGYQLDLLHQKVPLGLHELSKGEVKEAAVPSPYLLSVVGLEEPVLRKHVSPHFLP